MKRSWIVLGLLAFAFASVITVPAHAVGGNYLRKGKDTVRVFTSGGRLYCRRTDGFEMCHGMRKSGGKWVGSKMKHPDMPGFMTFNGTVTIGATTLHIKGCAIGQSMCDAETWKKK